MRWFEYKAEVDALHAPEALKEQLRAMKQNAGEAPVQGRTRRRAVRFGWKRAAGMAACFVGGAVTVLVVGSGMLFGVVGMGASAGDSAAAENSATQAADEIKQPMSDVAESAGGIGTGVVFDGDRNAAAERKEVAGSEAVNDANRSLGAEATGKQAAATRKIIYTANLTLESTAYDSTLTALQQALDAAEGYVESSENRNYGTDHRQVHYTLRVPAANYQGFLSAAEGIGSLTEKNEDSQDITAEYVDVAARIDTLEKQRDRLQQLSAQAETLTDLLEIEEKLSDVQYQLERYQRQMAVYDDRVNYCTVNLSVYEVTVYTPVQPTAGEQLWNALTRGFEDFAEALFDGVLWVLRNLSWLAVLAVCGVAARLVWKKKRG